MSILYLLKEIKNTPLLAYINSFNNFFYFKHSFSCECLSSETAPINENVYCNEH